MVLLTCTSTLAMHPARTRTTNAASPEAGSNGGSSAASSPLPAQSPYVRPEDSGRYAPVGYSVLLASELFYSPTHSEAIPAFAKSMSQGRHHHHHHSHPRHRVSNHHQHIHQNRNRSSLIVGSSAGISSGPETAMAPDPGSSKRLSYTSLTSLNEWSPATVSVSALLRRHDARTPRDSSHGPSVNHASTGSNSVSVDRDGGYVSINGNPGASTKKESTEENFYYSMDGTCGKSLARVGADRLTQHYPIAPVLSRKTSDQSGTPSQRQYPASGSSRTLRRSVSAEPHQRVREALFHRETVTSPSPGGSRGPSSPRQPSDLLDNPDPTIPRACSHGDLLESEYVTLDAAYRTLEKVQRQDSRGSRSTDSMHRKSSDVTSNDSSSTYYVQSSSPSSFSTATPSALVGGNVRRTYSDEKSYVHSGSGCNSSGGSSGYGSNGSSGGWTKPGRSATDPFSQRNDTKLGDAGSATQQQQQRRSGSAERPWMQPHPGHVMTSPTTPPFDLARFWVVAPSRKKSGQTLQTVAEVLPGKSILKNGGSKSGSSGLTSTRTVGGSAGGSSSQESATVSDTPVSAKHELRNTAPSLLPQTQSAAPVHGTLVRRNDAYNTFGGISANAFASLRSTRSGERGGGAGAPPHRLRLRSKSLSDLRLDPDLTATNATLTSGCYSDDEDGDDFGFLPLPAGGVTVVSRPPTAMQKAKGTEPGGGSASPSHRLLPRRWRNKTKSSSAAGAAVTQPMWSPEGPCTWCSVSGRKVVLKPVNILHLSEAERLALQKLAVSKLQAMDLACPIVIPKDAGDQRRHKKRALSLKRRSKSANLASLLDTLGSSDKGKDKENKDFKPGLVFGIPLARCIANDRELAKQRAFSQNPALQSRGDIADHLLAPRPNRKSSSSSQGSLDNGAQNGALGIGSVNYDSTKRAASSDSLSESDQSSRNTSSSFMEALTSPSPQGRPKNGSQAVGSTHQVPHIVDACFKHLETHGIHVLGIFRVGSSKKRVKQLREEFDSGKEVQLTEEHNPHDVGALLKEFFRDLPEPLLSRDLYLPFVTTRKIQDRQLQAEAMRLLLTLLPPANRDTLWVLLRFLATVHRHSEDTTDRNGTEIPGNKMDSHNLAVLFGPNILHRARATTEKQFMAECAEQAEQSSEIISVIKDMIDNHFELFEISANQYDELLKLMMEVDQENLDRVLRRLSNENQIEPDPESTCSVFEESDHSGPHSLPHSASSDADLLSLVTRKTPVMHHRPLRVSRSADPWTEPPERASSVGPGCNPFTEGRRVCSLEERLSPSPSPQDSPSMGPFSSSSCIRAGTPGQPPLVTVSLDSKDLVVMRNSAGRRRGQDAATSGALSTTRPLSSGPVPVTFGLGPGGGLRDRPNSETYPGLPVPRPAYLRENSGASSASSNYLSSSGGGHGGCDASPENSGPWGTLLGSDSGNTPPTSQGSSPQPQRRVTKSASTSRSPNTVSVSPGSSGRYPSSSRSVDDDGSGPAIGSPEWQRERWRHWEQITAGKNHGAADDNEQETLV